MNLELLHQVTVNQILLYLKRYKNLSLKLSENDEYVVTSDASFVNNITDQKSLQNYIMKLFENLVK